MPYKLTPKKPSDATGLTHEWIGWHFVLREALDVLEGVQVLRQLIGWHHSIYDDPEDGTKERLSLISPDGDKQIDVLDTYWILWDDTTIIKMDEATADANYNIAPYTLPLQQGGNSG